MNPIVEKMYTQIGQDMRHSPSAVGRWLNGTILSVDEGKLRVEFVVRPEMTNPMHILHGGATAMMIDEIIGATVHTLNHEHFFTSVNLSIDFLAPAKEGERVVAVAEIIRQGKTIVNANCRILSESGKIIAIGTSNLVRTHLEKKTEQSVVTVSQPEKTSYDNQKKKGHKRKDHKKKTRKGKRGNANKNHKP